MLYEKKTTAKMMSKPSPKKVAIEVAMMTPKETKKLNKSINKMAAKPSPAKMKPAPKSKSAGLIPLPMKKGSPKPKKVNLPGKKTKPSPMINY